MREHFEDMTGRRFGRLVVLEKIKESGKAKYKVRCDCGREKVVLADNLRRGMTTSCGKCYRETKEFAMSRVKDITGKRFGRLVVIKELGNRKVLCKCDCGKEKIINKSHLVDGDIRSCGCLLRNQAKNNQEKYYQDGTYISALKNTEATSRSKSGVRGVCWHSGRGKWRASIGFKGKNYELGLFDDIHDAIKARKEAEDRFYKPVIDAFFEEANNNGNN